MGGGRVSRNRLAAFVGVAVAVVVVAAAAGVALGLAHRWRSQATGAGTPTAAAVASPTGTPPATVRPSPTASPQTHVNILDGVPMSEATWTTWKDRLPIAVMIDNAPGAYPQAGLDKAAIVYEALVEGGITRMMAVYWGQDASYIEPVRSARTPFLYWVSELGAIYGYAGEADTTNGANAGGQIPAWGVRGVDALYGSTSAAYYRDSSRVAPHNLVTSTAALRAAAAAEKVGGAPWTVPWSFKSDGVGTGSDPAAGGAQIQFTAGLYPWQIVQWHWDSASGMYLRYQFGGPAVDKLTGKQLAFKNVVIMTAKSYPVDAVGHVLIDLVGTGRATILMDGKEVAATWKKTSRDARTMYYDAAGNEIAFDRGPIFVEVVPPTAAVTIAAAPGDLPQLPPAGS